MMYVLIGLCAISILLNIALAAYNHRVVHWANYWKLEALREKANVRGLYQIVFAGLGGEDDDRQGVESACVPEG